jgi:hypothetical protein
MGLTRVATNCASSCSGLLAPSPGSGWDNAFNPGQWTFSGTNDKTATHSGGDANQTIIGSRSHTTTGKFYFEVNVENVSGNLDAWIGIAQSGVTPNTFIGFDAVSWAYRGQNGNKRTNNTAAAYGASFDTGDIIGVTVDFDAGDLVFSKNGVAQGTAYTGLTYGTVFPAGTLFFDTGFLTLRTVLAEFQYFPGAGAVQWG